MTTSFNICKNEFNRDRKEKNIDANYQHYLSCTGGCS